MRRPAVSRAICCTLATRGALACAWCASRADSPLFTTLAACRRCAAVRHPADPCAIYYTLATPSALACAWCASRADSLLFTTLAACRRCAAVRHPQIRVLFTTLWPHDALSPARGAPHARIRCYLLHLRHAAGAPPCAIRKSACYLLHFGHTTRSRLRVVRFTRGFAAIYYTCRMPPVRRRQNPEKISDCASKLVRKWLESREPGVIHVSGKVPM